MLVALAVALSLAACGSSEEGPAAHVRQNALVTRSAVEHYPRGSVERAFLEYWSNLQFNSWADVAAFYDPALREFIGTAKLVAAKKTGSSVYPFLQPEIKETKKNENGITTVYYTLSMEDGSTELASTSWRQNQGNWQIVFDSRLDGELSALAQERVALEESGGELAAERPPSSAALEAGRAAAHLQARFLAQALNESKP